MPTFADIFEDEDVVAPPEPQAKFSDIFDDEEPEPKKKTPIPVTQKRSWLGEALDVLGERELAGTNTALQELHNLGEDVKAPVRRALASAEYGLPQLRIGGSPLSLSSTAQNWLDTLGSTEQGMNIAGFARGAAFPEEQPELKVDVSESPVAGTAVDIGKMIPGATSALEHSFKGTPAEGTIAGALGSGVGKIGEMVLLGKAGLNLPEIAMAQGAAEGLQNPVGSVANVAAMEPLAKASQVAMGLSTPLRRGAAELALQGAGNVGLATISQPELVAKAARGETLTPEERQSLLTTAATTGALTAYSGLAGAARPRDTKPNVALTVDAPPGEGLDPGDAPVAQKPPVLLSLREREILNQPIKEWEPLEGSIDVKKPAPLTAPEWEPLNTAIEVKRPLPFQEPVREAETPETAQLPGEPEHEILGRLVSERVTAPDFEPAPESIAPEELQPSAANVKPRLDLAEPGTPSQLERETPEGFSRLSPPTEKLPNVSRETKPKVVEPKPEPLPTSLQTLDDWREQDIPHPNVAQAKPVSGPAPLPRRGEAPVEAEPPHKVTPRFRTPKHVAGMPEHEELLRSGHFSTEPRSHSALPNRVAVEPDEGASAVRLAIFPSGPGAPLPLQDVPTTNVAVQPKQKGGAPNVALQERETTGGARPSSGGGERAAGGAGVRQAIAERIRAESKQPNVAPIAGAKRGAKRGAPAPVAEVLPVETAGERVASGGDAEANRPVAVPEENLVPPVRVQEGLTEAPPSEAAPVKWWRDEDVVRIPTKDIGVLAKDLQFKIGANENGVVPSERLMANEWADTDKGTAPLIVWQRKDGKVFVVNGHHRLDLAKRLEAEGKKTTPDVATVIHREADGVTIEDAKALGALSNIRDGAGKVADYASFFRNSKISEEAARKGGLLDRSKGKNGWLLGRNASEDILGNLEAGTIHEDQAVAIVANAPTRPEIQNAVLSYLLRDKGNGRDRSASWLANASKNASMKKARDTKGLRTIQDDMLGGDAEWFDEIVRRTDAQEKLIAETLDDVVSIRSSGRRAEKAKKFGVNVKNPAAVEALIQKFNARIKDIRSDNPSPEVTAEINRLAGIEDETFAPPVAPEEPAPLEGEADFLGGEEEPPAVTAPLPKPPIKPKGGDSIEEVSPVNPVRQERVPQGAQGRKAVRAQEGREQGNQEVAAAGGENLAAVPMSLLPASEATRRSDLQAEVPGDLFGAAPRTNVAPLRPVPKGWERSPFSPDFTEKPVIKPSVASPKHRASNTEEVFLSVFDAVTNPPHPGYRETALKWLREAVHPRQPQWRAQFEEMTGLKLPDNPKQSAEMVDAFFAPKKSVPRPVRRRGVVVIPGSGIIEHLANELKRPSRNVRPHLRELATALDYGAVKEESIHAAARTAGIEHWDHDKAAAALKAMSPERRAVFVADAHAATELIPHINKVAAQYAKAQGIENPSGRKAFGAIANSGADLRDMLDTVTAIARDNPTVKNPDILAHNLVETMLDRFEATGLGPTEPGHDVLDKQTAKRYYALAENGIMPRFTDPLLKGLARAVRFPMDLLGNSIATTLGDTPESSAIANMVKSQTTEDLLLALRGKQDIYNARKPFERNKVVDKFISQPDNYRTMKGWYRDGADTADPWFQAQDPTVQKMLVAASPAFRRTTDMFRDVALDLQSIGEVPGFTLESEDVNHVPQMMHPASQRVIQNRKDPLYHAYRDGLVEYYTDKLGDADAAENKVADLLHEGGTFLEAIRRGEQADDDPFSMREHKFGNIDLPRNLGLPDTINIKHPDGRVETVDFLDNNMFSVMDRFIARAAHRLAGARHFGTKGEKFGALFENIDKNVPSAVTAARTAYDTSLGAGAPENFLVKSAPTAATALKAVSNAWLTTTLSNTWMTNLIMGWGPVLTIMGPKATAVGAAKGARELWGEGLMRAAHALFGSDIGGEAPGGRLSEARISNYQKIMRHQMQRPELETIGAELAVQGAHPAATAFERVSSHVGERFPTNVALNATDTLINTIVGHAVPTKLNGFARDFQSGNPKRAANATGELGEVFEMSPAMISRIRAIAKATPRGAKIAWPQDIVNTMQRTATAAANARGTTPLQSAHLRVFDSVGGKTAMPLIKFTRIQGDNTAKAYRLWLHGNRMPLARVAVFNGVMNGVLRTGLGIALYKAMNYLLWAEENLDEEHFKATVLKQLASGGALGIGGDIGADMYGGAVEGGPMKAAQRVGAHITPPLIRSAGDVGELSWDLIQGDEEQADEDMQRIAPPYRIYRSWQNAE